MNRKNIVDFIHERIEKEENECSFKPYINPISVEIINVLTILVNAAEFLIIISYDIKTNIESITDRASRRTTDSLWVRKTRKARASKRDSSDGRT